MSVRGGYDADASPPSVPMMTGGGASSKGSAGRSHGISESTEAVKANQFAVAPGAYHSTTSSSKASSRNAKMLAIDDELVSLPSRVKIDNKRRSQRPVSVQSSNASSSGSAGAHAKTSSFGSSSAGAHAIRGLGNKEEVEEEKVEATEDFGTTPIAAEVCQSQTSIDDARAQDIENRLRSQLLDNTVSAQHVVPESKGISKQCIWWILLVVLFLIVVGVVIGVVVGIMGNTSTPNTTAAPTTPPAPTPPPITSQPSHSPTVYIQPCTLCLDGSQPDLEAEVRRGVTCADLQNDLARLDDAADPICLAGQAQGWIACSCPTLPPRQSNPICSVVCPEDSRPPAFNTQQCQDYETFVELAGLEAEDCTDLIAGTPTECACSGEIDQLRAILSPAVSAEEDLLDTTTPQYKAMTWLANEDPASLPISSTPGLDLQMRYFGALLWFSLGGESWNDQYGFLSSDEVCNWNDGDSGILCSSFRNTITSVIIEQNSLIGTLPGLELTAFESLEVLDLSENDVKGSIPSSIGKLSALRILEIEENVLFGGTLPSSLFALSRLARVRLDDCNLSGSLPSNIGEATSLTWLTLFNMGLTGTIPASVSQLTRLEHFWIQDNGLSGPLPAIDEMHSLVGFVMFDNFLTGSIPAHYGELPTLEVLFVGQNELEGTIPDFSRSLSLKNLDMQQNRLEGNIERFFTTTPTEMENLYLDGNQLTGSLPARIGVYRSLATLQLHNNPTLSGTLPTELGLLAQALDDFDVSGTLLNGTLPSYLGRLTVMGDFDVATCQFTGTLPSEMGFMTALSLLSLNSNQFSGTIPLEFANLQNLEQASFANNRLSGTVPIALSMLPKLTELLLQSNDFTGSLDSFCNSGLQSPITLRADCEAPAEIMCSCCETCL